MPLPRLARRWICCLVAILGVACSAPAISQTASTPGEGRQDATAGASQPSVVETQWNLVELNGTAALMT
jgi:hypothetical protein